MIEWLGNIATALQDLGVGWSIVLFIAFVLTTFAVTKGNFIATIAMAITGGIMMVAVQSPLLFRDKLRQDLERQPGASQEGMAPTPGGFDIGGWHVELS